MTVIFETAPALVEWPLAGGLETAVRCVCAYEAPAHVPDVGAVMVYGLALVGVGLTAFALGALQRRRRRFA